MSYHLLLILLSVSFCLSGTTGQEKQLGKLQSQIDRLQSIEAKQDSEIASLLSRVSTLESFENTDTGDRISFLARVSSSYLPEADSTIIFRNVLQNYGNAYNANTGKFTAPISGLYMFHISAISRGLVQVDLVRDGDLLATAWGYHGSSDVQGSNMAIVYLRKHQRVWARFEQGKDRLGSGGYTQFTGALLRRG